MNKLGVESIISNICGKNKDMNSHLFSADMKLADVIHADYSLLLLLHRFGINLGFGDKTVRECCEANHVSCTLFLMICNVYSNEQYLPTEKEIRNRYERGPVDCLLEKFSFLLLGKPDAFYSGAVKRDF